MASQSMDGPVVLQDLTPSASHTVWQESFPVPSFQLMMKFLMLLSSMNRFLDPSMNAE